MSGRYVPPNLPTGPHFPADEVEAAQRRVARKRAARVASRSAILPTRPKVSPTLEIVEIDGHGRAFEVYERGEYLGTWDGKTGAGYRRESDDWHGPSLGKRFGGRLALVYGYDAYEKACAERIAADPDDWDCSDVVPAPFLVMVRHAPKANLMAELEQAVVEARREAGR